MKKIFTLLAAMCCVMGLMAIPVPKNFSINESGVISWEHDPLGADSTFSGTTVKFYTESGSQLTTSNGSYNTYTNMGPYLYAGRSYYVRVHYGAYSNAEGSGNSIAGPDAEWHFTVAGDPTEVLTITTCSMDSKAYVTWTRLKFAYVPHRVTIQRKNSSDGWDNIEVKVTPSGWDQQIQMSSLPGAGTYRAVIECVQGEDVVTRGITEELVVKEMFAISFDAQGLFPNPDAQQVEQGQTVNIPAATAQLRESNKIVIWYKDAAGTQPWNFQKDVVDGAMTLYACKKDFSFTMDWTVINSKVYGLINVDSIYQGQFTSMSTKLNNEKNDVCTVIGNTFTTRIMWEDYLLPGHSYAFITTITDLYGNITIAASPDREIAGEYVVKNIPLTLSGTMEVRWHSNPLPLIDTIWVDEFVDGEWVNKYEYPFVSGLRSYYNIGVPMDAAKAYRARLTSYQGSVLYGKGVGYAGKANSAVGDTIAVAMSGYNLYYKVTDATEKKVELVKKTTDNYAPYPAGEYPTGELVLPETVANIYGQTYTLSGIGERALFKSKLTKLTIPATVTTLGNHAFAASASLKEVVLAERPTCLETSAGAIFNGCPIDTLDITYWTGFTNATGINPLLSSNIKGYKGKNNWYEAIDGALCYTFYYHRSDKNLEICHLGARTTDLVLPTDMKYVTFQSKAFESMKTDIDIYMLTNDIKYLYFYPAENAHIQHLYIPCGKLSSCKGDGTNPFLNGILSETLAYTVTLGAVEHGTIAIVEVPENDCDEVTIEATPAEDYELVGWNVEGVVDGNRITLTVTEDTEVIATFKSTKQDPPTGLQNSSAAQLAEKRIVNGNLYFVLDGRYYDATGRAVRL